MHVADQPAPFHVTHDVLNRCKRLIGRRLVIHRQKNAGEYLHHQYDQGKYAEYVPPVEILGRIILSDVVLHRFRPRETIIDPLYEATLRDADF